MSYEVGLNRNVRAFHVMPGLPSQGGTTARSRLPD